MSAVVIANLINLVGSGLITLAYIMISLSNKRSTYMVFTVGSVLVVVGSLILKSYPMVFLNAIWAAISINKYFNNSIKITISPKVNSILNSLIAATGMAVLIGLALNNHIYYDIAGYFVSCVYILSYLLFIAGNITKLRYLSCTLIVFVFLVPHLLVKIQVALLVNEVICAIAGSIGIIKILRLKNKTAIT